MYGVKDEKWLVGYIRSNAKKRNQYYCIPNEDSEGNSLSVVLLY